MSLVRQNLMERQGYSPYCGSQTCQFMPRTKFIKDQFECPSCGWRSSFDTEFISKYKTKWNLENGPSKKM